MQGKVKRASIKRIVLVLIAFCLFGDFGLSQTVIYSEDFTGQDDKGQIGSTSDLTGVAWNINVVDGGFTNEDDYFAVQSGIFQAQDVDGTVIWESESFDISGFTSMAFSFEASADGDFEASGDIFDVEIEIDGAAEALFSGVVDESLDDDPMFFGATQLTSELQAFSKNITGTGASACIKITINNNAGSELFGFDNLELTGIFGGGAPDPEPSNHVTGFTATSVYLNQIDLSWNDNDGPQSAAGFLIVGKTGAGSYYSPVDGTEPVEDNDWSDNSIVVQVNHGAENYSITGLNPETNYDFRIYPYTNSGSEIDFKTNGTVPSTNAITGSEPDLPLAWINELHYDNAGGDENEGVEVVIKNPGAYSLSDFQITFYNGSDQKADDSHSLDSFTEGNSEFGYTLYYKMIAGIQNGPDGIALGYNGELIQFLSYEGEFTALDGVAGGQRSIDIGVEESESTEPAQSLQLTGDGFKYSDFTWQANLPQTFGSQNNGGDQSLPVELSDFTAEYSNGVVTLRWTTASEVDNAGFNIFRSINNQKTFRKINGQLIPGAGNSTSKKEYRFKDQQIIEGIKYFYKLQDVSFAGKKEFSNVISINPKPPKKSKTPETFRITNCYPNPFNPYIQIRFCMGDVSKPEIKIYDLNSRLVKSFSDFENKGGFGQVIWFGKDNADNPVSSGIYFCKIMADDGRFDVKKFTLIR
jgi:hypothetical protein